MKILVIQNLYVTMRNKSILKNVNLEVGKGKTLVILGPAGAGKTTLLKTIFGIISPYQGRILFEGNDITKLRGESRLKVQQRIGAVFQDSALCDYMTVGENVGSYFREHTSMKEQEIKKRIRELLKLVALEHTANHKLGELSEDMKRRIALCKAIAIPEPKLALLDEPAASLDPQAKSTIFYLVSKIQHTTGIALLVTTEEIRGALAIGDEFALLLHGKIVFEGNKFALLNPKNEVAKEFLKSCLDQLKEDFHK